MGPVQGHQCPYDAPSVAEHFRKTGTVNLNPADVLLFRDSLEWLHLYDNELSGEIPAELGSLSNLRELSLGENDLSGCVPSSLADQLNFVGLEIRGLPYC